MKNLIKEIEGLKLETHPEETEYRFGFRDGNNTCVVSVKHILNQYNLITAPKQIKLSEVVSRLSETVKEKLLVEDGMWCKKAIGYYIRCWEDYDFDELVGFDKNMKITHVAVKNDDKHKWLYALWIAGTEIIDDMEELNNAKD